MSFEEKRRFPRYDTANLKGTLVFSVQAEVINISLSGMAVEAPTPFTVGQSYSVRLGQEPESLHLNASTRWCELARVAPDDDGGQSSSYRSGFSFDDVVVGQTAAIQKFLETRVVLDVDERLFGRLAPKVGQLVALESQTSFSVLRLSVGGVLIETEAIAPIGSIQKLRIDFGVPFTIEARVASLVQPSVQENRLKHRMGLEFTDLGREEHEALARFIQRELQGQPDS